MSTEEKYVTVKKAALMLGVSPLTLRNWDKAGKLTAVRNPMNNYRVYREADIRKLILDMRSGTAPLKVKKRPDNKPKKLFVRHLEV